MACRISASCVRRCADSVASRRLTMSSLDDGLEESSDLEEGEDRRLIRVGENCRSVGRF
jgi:hypothetical protein